MNDLIEGLKRKDSAAFKKVMDMYKNKIYNYLRLMLNNEQLAEELTQDTFVRVYFKAKTIRTENLKAWIYTIATNLARSEFRKRKIKNFFSLSEVNEGYFSYFSSHEDQIILEQILTTLPEKYRIPVIMREIDRFSFDEISKMLNKPIGTIKTLVFRGKDQLRQTFSDQDDSRSQSLGMIKKGVKNELC